MFDNKEMQAYRNIKVPSELKTRILADCNAESVRGKRNIGGAFPRGSLIRSLSAVAACLVLAVAIFSMTRMETSFVALSYEGTPVSDEPVAIAEVATLSGMESRIVRPTGIPLSFDVKGDAEITVSGGCLFCVSEDGEEIEELSQSAKIRGRAELWWAVVGSEVYELTVEASDGKTTYVLDMTESSPSGVIYKK